MDILKTNTMKNYFILFLGAALIIMAALMRVSFNQADKIKELNNLLGKERLEFNAIIGNNGAIIVSQEQTIASMEGIIQAGIVERDELKALNIKHLSTVVKLEQEIARLRFEAEYTSPPVIITVPADTSEYMRIPQGYAYNSRWMSFEGFVDRGGIVVDNFRMPNQVNFYIGTQRQGLFRPLKPVVIVENTNPHIATTRMENAIVLNKPPFYKRPWWHRLEGAAMLYGVYRISKL